MSINDDDSSVTLQNGSVIQLHSQPQSLATTTGWVTWNASIALIRYLERLQQSKHAPFLLPGSRVADLSSGNGLVALAAAYLGASSVLATEIPACSTLTRWNVDANPQVKHLVRVVDYKWGDDVCPIQGCDLVIGSDLLFIAIRDNIYDQLRRTLVEICSANKTMLFGYEERIIDKERAFMASLEHDCALVVEAVPEGQIDVGIDSVDIFFEAPSIRMYILSRASVD